MLVCPDWCVDHREAPDASAPDEDAAHWGPKQTLVIPPPPGADETSVVVQACAFDDFGSRWCCVDLVLPDEDWVQLPQPLAYQAATLLVSAADTCDAVGSVAGPRPSWCESGSRTHPDDGSALHSSPKTQLRSDEPPERDLLSVQVFADDEKGFRTTNIDLWLQSGVVTLTADQARLLAGLIQGEAKRLPPVKT